VHEGSELPPACLCAGLSVRWITEALAARGVAVHALDCFGDRDTRVAAHRWTAIGTPAGGIDAARVSAVAATLPSGLPLWYLAGFEGAPGALACLAHGRPLLGNPPALLARLASAARWRAVLRSCGLTAPEILLPGERLPALADGHWLVKRAGSSGGGHIRRYRPDLARARADYLQRFEPGPSFGVAFLAHGGAARIIGVVRHLRLQRRLRGAFAQGAAIALPRLPEPLRLRLAADLGRLVRHLGLRGVNGADFILRREGTVAWLELNARLPGSLPLTDPSGDWLAMHAGGGPMPVAAVPEVQGAPMSAAGGVWRAQSVVYAPHDLRVPRGMAWPAWAHDRPFDGARFRAGVPWVSIDAEASSAREALLTLRRRMNILAALPFHSDGWAPHRAIHGPSRHS